MRKALKLIKEENGVELWQSGRQYVVVNKDDKERGSYNYETALEIFEDEVVRVQVFDDDD